MKTEVYTDMVLRCENCEEKDPVCASCRKFIRPDGAETCEVYCFDDTHLCSCCNDEKDEEKKQ